MRIAMYDKCRANAECKISEIALRDLIYNCL